MLSNISSVKALRKEGSAVLRRQTELETQREQRQLALVYKMRKGGMQGMRVGRHKVPEQEVDVQLGEDLSESLRALKVGSLSSPVKVGSDHFLTSPKEISSGIDSKAYNSAH